MQDHEARASDRGQEIGKYCPQELQDFRVYIPLTNRVRGPYRKLGTEFFPFDL